MSVSFSLAIGGPPSYLRSTAMVLSFHVRHAPPCGVKSCRAVHSLQTLTRLTHASEGLQRAVRISGPCEGCRHSRVIPERRVIGNTCFVRDDPAVRQNVVPVGARVGTTCCAFRHPFGHSPDGSGSYTQHPVTALPLWLALRTGQRRNENEHRCQSRDHGDGAAAAGAVYPNDGPQRLTSDTTALRRSTNRCPGIRISPKHISTANVPWRARFSGGSLP